MGDRLTEQQLQAVTDRGGRLLVSAAAGSGKTKVLVERLLSYITDPISPANVDDFLIITYTKAAASELRGKIASRLTEAISDTPENKHLLRQLQRLHLTKISTVHSFCADILREYAYMLDITSDFRVADEDECLELRNRALQIVMDEAYANTEDEQFFEFVDTQGFGRDDRRIPEIILQVYNAAKCHLDPDKWLNWCDSNQGDDQITDVAQTPWGSYLIRELQEYLDLQISALSRCADAATSDAEMGKPALILSETIEQLRALRNCSLWDDICDRRNIDYGRLTFSKRCTDEQLVNQIKAVREACKTGLTKRLSMFADKSQTVLLDNRENARSIAGLIALVRKFEMTYARLKRGRRVLDFTDLEHKTLDLLLGKHRNGATKAACEISQRFREVMVDEYQDSNAVQDAIFTVLTENQKNCFMVGDVKQSIYQFRLADPSIFIEKYNRYLPAGEAKAGQGRKIVLSRNFRSSGAVIKAVNDVFDSCMSPRVGGLVYGHDEALYEGIPHIPLNEQEVELYGIDVQEDTYQEEATFVAERIRQLLDGTHMVRQGDTLRPITPGDIVILLRSPGSVGFEYQWALEQQGIRCVSGAGTDLLQTEEIETLSALLTVINNPLVDIPLVTVMMSRVFGFTADELAEIRKDRKYGSIYAAVKAAKSKKAANFLETLSLLRKAAPMKTLSQLLMLIFSVTRIDSIYSAMPDGSTRVANLQQFCQLASAFENTSSGGLGRFLEHLEILSNRGIPTATEEASSEAVTIMSIHKSKGLEFPVVFLCGLSRDFNMESSRAQVLCDKDLGLGLSCVDIASRVRYPSLAKKAIAAKIRAESISEELRVLYVAMTRARDRLIMTYSARGIEDEMDTLSLRMAFSDSLLLTTTVTCPGTWILMTANLRKNSDIRVRRVLAPDAVISDVAECTDGISLHDETIQELKRALEYQYPYKSAVATPSKQTATQLKGREKDRQASEHTVVPRPVPRILRKPSFCSDHEQASERGTAMHAVMQYIRFDACDNTECVRNEISRLVREGFITQEQADYVDAKQIACFFESDLGKQIRNSKNVLREFKFSILVEADDSNETSTEDMILLQGVVDCAMIDLDGLTVIDFKSDRIDKDGLAAASQRYSQQVTAYARSLARIYQLPVKAALLYFFTAGKFVKII